jgi:hypothetical protein
LFRPFSLIGTLLLCMVPALGTTVSFSVNPFTLTGAPGDELIYSGTVAASADVLLNGLCFSFTAAACDIGSSPGLGFFTSDSQDDTFYSNVPGFFPSGKGYFGPVFAIVIDPTTSVGTYFGTVTLLGQPDGFGFDPQGSGTFQLVVATPEPATVSFLMLGIGLISLIGLLHTKRILGGWPV